MKRRVYAFGNYFDHADRRYTLAEQWSILRDLGYDAGYLAVNPGNAADQEACRELPALRARTGLDLAAVYCVGEPWSPAGGGPVADVIARLSPGDTLELALNRGWNRDLSDPRLDDEAVTYLRPLLAAAQVAGVTLSLYHHFGFWLERVDDCVRLAARLNDPRLRVTFCGFHWYACEGGAGDGPGAKLRLAGPWLHRVNVCGSRFRAPAAPGTLPATVEPVGDGDFPLEPVLRGLDAAGYAGPVGFQGYRVGGHPPATLQRSLAAFRAVEARLART